MQPLRNKINLLLTPVVLLTILACGIGGGNQNIDSSPPAEVPTTSLPVDQPIDLPTDQPTDLPVSTPTEVPVLVTVTEQLQVPVSGNGNEIVPVFFPELRSGNAGDFDSSKAFENKTPIGGDRFTFGRFERPFNTETMDTYFPYLDIVDTFVYQDDTWVFARIVLHGPDANKQFPGKYAAELDLDLDGKGDWLVIASAPSSTDWVTTGVQVYQDADSSVGDRTAGITDNKAAKGNGFETLVFDQGNGDDPETAWVRLSPDAANTVEIAIKRSIFNVSGPNLRYLIGMWAGTNLEPALFDLNDSFTHEQAGAAEKGLTYFYPIKAIAELDNSCRMAVGFQPTGREPGICEQPVKPGEPGVPGVPGFCTDAAALEAACLQQGGYYWDAPSCTCKPYIIY